MALINVPNPGQTLGNSRPSINSNFAVIDAAFQVDHVDYSTSGQGQHNKVSFPTQNPVPAPQAGIVQLYSQLSALTAQQELVFARQTGSLAPTLATQIVEFTSAGWSDPGWTRLPSGILLKWHSGINMTNMATVTKDLNVDVPGSPGFTTVFSVFNSSTSLASYNTIVDIQSIVGTVVIFAINGLVRPPAGYTIAYLAIGI